MFEKNDSIADWRLPRRISILWGMQLAGLNIIIFLLMYSLGTRETRCESRGVDKVEPLAWDYGEGRKSCEICLKRIIWRLSMQRLRVGIRF